MKYLLDANVVIRLLNRDQQMTAQVRRFDKSDFGLPAVVMHELYFGAFKSRHVQRNIGYIQALEFEILDFRLRDAIAAGEIRATLAAKGTPIGPFDLLIAGQAVERDLTLVSHNIREFSRVPKLRLEDWEL